jgi:serine/threonine-protein kinase PpkA
MKFSRCMLIGMCLFLTVSLVQTVCAQDRKPVVIEGKTFLPLRVLVRPFSNIYQQADETSPIVQENVPVFQPYYVYTRPKISTTDTQAKGWYEVGSNNRGAVLGWMKADDVMEWKQTMCLTYEHPSGRKPVLMFDDLNALRALVKAPAEARKTNANQIYQEIESGNIPQNFPVVSVEPKDAVDITSQFYLLPILEHASIEIDGREGRLLKLAAATKTGRGASDISTPPKEAPPSQAPAVSIQGNPEAAMMKNLKMDIVYVVDMTASMQPYIDATLKAVKKISMGVTSNPEIAESVKFGLWGFRDSTEIFGIEFNTKNFTPQLQPVQAFEQILAGVTVAHVGSKDYPEDMFSGLDKAVRETQWTQGAIPIVVLLGDAPGHETGHKWNLSGQSASTLRTLADDQKITVFAVHVKDGRAENFWEMTETQFRAVSLNRGMETASYFDIPASELDKFELVSKDIAGSLVEMIEDLRSGKITAADAQKAASAPAVSTDVVAQVKKAGYAAFVDWIGREKGAQAPRDIIAWVTDKDLIDPAIQSLDVRVLIDKKQLDSLKSVLQEIMIAGRKGQISGEDFFDALQAVPSAASRAGDQIKNAQSLAETGLAPEFMTDLPYKSQIMNMSNEMWASFGQDQQDEFLNEIDAKIKLYVAIHDDPQGWIALNKGDDPDEHVYPLSLNALP